MLANERETLKLLKQLSKSIIALNWFSGSVQAGIMLQSICMSECKCIKEISYYMYHDSRTCFRVLIWNLYLNLRWMDIKRKYYWWRKCLGTRTAWTASKQVWVLSWAHGKKCPFSSQMKSFIPTFRGMHLQFICVKKLFTCYHDFHQ